MAAGTACLLLDFAEYSSATNGQEPLQYSHCLSYPCCKTSFGILESSRMTPERLQVHQACVAALARLHEEQSTGTAKPLPPLHKPDIFVPVQALQVRCKLFER